MTDHTSEQEPDRRSHALLTAPVHRSVLAMAAPMLVGILAMVSVDVVDAYFVGQLGEEPLAALSFCFPVMFFVAGVSSSLGAGVQTIVSNAVGLGDSGAAKRVVTQSLLLAFVAVGVLIIAGFTLMEPMFRLLGATDSTLPLIASFMTIWLPAAIFVVLPYVGGGALMADGDATTPAIFMIGASILNAIFDPLFIFGLGPFPELGISGAAVGTAVARGTATLFAIAILVRRGLVRFDAKTLTTMLETWRRVGRVAASIALIGFLMPLTLAVVTRLMSDYGDAAVAAFGAGTRITALAMLIPSSLSVGLMPVLGQNWGAQLYDRGLRAFGFAKKVTIFWSVGAWATLAITAPWIAVSFLESDAAATELRLVLSVFPAGAIGFGVLYVCNTAMNSIERTVAPTVIMVVRTFCLVIPFTWVGSRLYGVAGILTGFVAADLIIGVTAHFVARRVLAASRDETPKPQVSLDGEL